MNDWHDFICNVNKYKGKLDLVQNDNTNHVNTRIITLNLSCFLTLKAELYRH